MMLRTSALALLICLSLAPTALAKSSPPAFAAALPSGAVRGSYTRLAGGGGVYAVTYEDAGWHVGLVAQRSGEYTLIWHHKLSGVPKKIDSPESGILRVVTQLPDGKGEELYAEKLHGESAVSAIAGHPSAHLASTEPPALKQTGFELRFPADHTGSVSYRLAEVFEWSGGQYRYTTKFLEPDYALADYPHPSAWVRASSGNTALIRLEIADTEAKREQGLMYRTSLDPDAGMIFVWPGLVLDSFWMQNTKIPLSIAWLSSDGTVQEIQDMQPETTDYHTPAQPYQYAIEANHGFFSTWGINVGDRFHLLLAP